MFTQGDLDEAEKRAYQQGYEDGYNSGYQAASVDAHG